MQLQMAVYIMYNNNRFIQKLSSTNYPNYERSLVLPAILCSALTWQVLSHSIRKKNNLFHCIILLQRKHGSCTFCMSQCTHIVPSGTRYAFTFTRITPIMRVMSLTISANLDLNKVQHCNYFKRDLRQQVCGNTIKLNLCVILTKHIVGNSFQDWQYLTANIDTSI